MSADAADHRRSTVTVAVALGVNVVIAVTKFAIGHRTGSASLLSEAGHSAVDVSTQVLLMVGVWRSRHPLRRCAEHRWAVAAAVGMFATGACYAFYEGVSTLSGSGGGTDRPGLAAVVLGGATAIEMVSLATAVAQLRRSGAAAASAVQAEDSADIVGNVLALVGVGLTWFTGLAMWEGYASLLVGLVITAAAWHVGAHNVRVLKEVKQCRSAASVATC